VAHTGEKVNACTVLVRKLKEKDHFEDLGIDGNHGVMKLGFHKNWISLVQSFGIG